MGSPSDGDVDDSAAKRPLHWWGALYLLDYGTVVFTIVCLILIEALMSPSGAFADNLHRLPKDYRESYYNFHVQDEAWPFYQFLPVVIVAPIVVIFVCQVWVTSLHDLHNGILGHIFGFALTGVVTGLMKNFFGDLRPDYLDRERRDDHEESGRRGMPSGHASLAMFVTLYLTLYLHGKLRPYVSRDGDGFIMYFVIAISSIVFGVFIGATRYTDHRHSLIQIAIGWLVGALVAIAVYCLVFYPPFHERDGQPKPHKSSIRQAAWRTSAAAES